MRRTYLDNNATTPVLPEVLDTMRPYFSEHFRNALSILHQGQETRAAVERSREWGATSPAKARARPKGIALL
jgi:cysteine desulfurase